MIELKKENVMTEVKNQLARDYNCKASDFDNHGVKFAQRSEFCSRVTQTDLLKIVSFYNSAVVTADKRIYNDVRNLLGNVKPEAIFQQPVVKAIAKTISAYNAEVDELFLHFVPAVVPSNIDTLDFEVKYYSGRDLEQFRGREEYSLALPFDNLAPDMLAVTAVIDGEIIGIAGARATSERLWEVGVNVDAHMSGNHVASKLLDLLKQKVLDHDAIPFYRTAISHILSQNVAINAGFKPAWSGLTTRHKRNVELRAASEIDLLLIQQMYMNNFPQEERKPFDEVLKISEVCGLFKRDALIGFMTYIEQGGYILLDYFAIGEEQRGKGLGKSALYALIDKFAGKKGVIIEIEEAGSASTESENITRTKRRNFYTQIGFVPTGDRISMCGVNMELLYFPIAKNPKEIFPIYKRLYEASHAPGLFDKRIKYLEKVQGD